MKRAEATASSLWAALGAALCLASFKLGMGTPSDPGSGFLPFWTGSLISFFSLLQLVGILFRKGRDGRPAATRATGTWRRPACLILTLALQGLLLAYLGYLVTTFFAMLVLFTIYDRRRWVLASAGSALVTIMTYVVFHQLLRVHLPVGILGIG
jgi:hypothetical protein